MNDLEEGDEDIVNVLIFFVDFCIVVIWIGWFLLLTYQANLV
jgi:hypothetical protein